ncbi:MAG: sulfite exporter TauE/SafE family protein [Acidimicrobiales bacterium]|nr:sulfite exporter TauE/SafE family protein [Acidimicrobiales bacterium]
MGAAEVTAVVLAVLLGGLIKSITGMGFPIVAIPVIAVVLSLEDAVAIIAIPNTIFNASLVFQARSAAPETRDLPRLAAYGIVGAVGGTLLLFSVPEAALLIPLIVMIWVYIISAQQNPTRQLTPAHTRRWAPAVGTAAGVAQGAVGISGPIVGAWIHAYRLPKQAAVLSVTVLFLLTGAAQLVVLVAAGSYDRDRLLLAVLAIIPMAITLPIGVRIRDRISTDAFGRAVLGILALSSIALTYRVLA